MSPRRSIRSVLAELGDAGVPVGLLLSRNDQRMPENQESERVLRSQNRPRGLKNGHSPKKDDGIGEMMPVEPWMNGVVQAFACLLVLFQGEGNHESHEGARKREESCGRIHLLMHADRGAYGLDLTEPNEGG
jgi:hypothetical protein